MKKRERKRSEGPEKGRHGSDWEHGAPEWSPGVRPGGGAEQGSDAGAGPAKAGDRPIEEPFGERSRHGASGRLPPPDDGHDGA